MAARRGRAASTCGKVDSQSIARCGSPIRPTSSIARIDGRGDRRRPAQSPRAHADGIESLAHASARSWMYDHSSSTASPSSAEGAIRGRGLDRGRRRPWVRAGHARSLRRVARRSADASAPACATGRRSARRCCVGGSASGPTTRALAASAPGRRSSARAAAVRGRPRRASRRRSRRCADARRAPARRRPRAPRPDRGSRDTGRGVPRRESSAPSSRHDGRRWSGWE